MSAPPPFPAWPLPFSLVGTFGVMYLCGFSLDNLSLMALTLCVGFVVDDAIVMLENIVRHIEQGEGVMQAALRGSQEIGFTIVAMTMSLCAVFIPVLFMGGVLGRLLHEFAVTIISAIMVSGFVSLTLTPMLCSRFLKPHHEIKHGRLFNLFENMQKGLEHVYDRSLRVVLRHKLAMMTASLLLIVGTAYLAIIIPEGLPAQRRHRSDQWHHRSGRRHLLRRHGGAPEGRGRDHPAGSRRRFRDVRRWRRRQNHEPSHPKHRS